MARPLRIEFPGAIYHVMSRGNGRQNVFLDDRDRERLLQGLESAVRKFDWLVMSYVWMPNHFHLFLKTPHPNLSAGIQYLVSGYANWFAKRHQRPGHLFQGRFKGGLVEDSSYFWSVSRYVHLNPSRGRRPLATHPRDWPWSSYLGYADRRRRFDWVAYDSVLAAWPGEMGGRDATAAYRRFVEAGLDEPPVNPMSSAAQGWLLGSDEFVRRMSAIARDPKYADEVPQAKGLRRLELACVLAAVAKHYKMPADALVQTVRGDVRKAVAAWLARRYTSVTRREISAVLRLGHPDSAANMVRRIDRMRTQSTSLRRDLAAVEQSLLKTQNRV
ncbi:MAG: transposase [Pirellulales bacterium]